MSDRTRKYRDDVFYEAWRRGVDPDRAADCAEDCYYDGRSPEECVDRTIARERSERERRQQEEWHQQEEERRAFEQDREREQEQ